MFVYYNGRLVNSDTIRMVQFDNLMTEGYIRLIMTDGRVEMVEGPEAFNIMTALCPAALEGQQGRYLRFSWAVHNFIGHPVMQICSWLGCTKLGLLIHDITVPNPITK